MLLLATQHLSQVSVSATKQAGRQAGRQGGRQAGRQAGKQAGRRAGNQPTNQPMDQPTNQSTNQPTNQQTMQGAVVEVGERVVAAQDRAKEVRVHQDEKAAASGDEVGLILARITDHSCITHITSSPFNSFLLVPHLTYFRSAAKRP